MEAWEKELRERLDKEVPEGLQIIGDPNIGPVVWSGKQGQIEFLVCLEKELRKSIRDVDTSLENEFSNRKIEPGLGLFAQAKYTSHAFKQLTNEELRTEITEIFKDMCHDANRKARTGKR